jgi:hypothetical protein
VADRGRDEVIEATLKAACIRASASVWNDKALGAAEPDVARRVVSLAKRIYLEATREKWQRGDDGEGMTGLATGPVVLTTSGSIVSGVAPGGGGLTSTGVLPGNVQVSLP